MAWIKLYNKTGDEVTLTAQADILTGKFLGWRYGNSSTLITDNPYSVKVNSSTEGSYTAVFESKETATKGIYCFIRNRSSNRTLGVTGNIKDSITINDRQFKHSLMLVPKGNFRSHSIPATIIKITGEPTNAGGLKEVEMIAQGVSTETLSGARFRMESALSTELRMYRSSAAPISSLCTLQTPLPFLFDSTIQL